MKTTIVPAQVTTVEDRIAGSLSLSQILLLASPVFLDSALYVLLPPFYHGAPYKIITLISIVILCALLSIRIKGKILLLWAVTLTRYYIRPRFYVYDKHSSLGRDSLRLTQETHFDTEAAPEYIVSPLPALSPAEQIRMEQLLTDPSLNVNFVNKKGNLYVHLTKAKSEV